VGSGQWAAAVEWGVWAVLLFELRVFPCSIGEATMPGTADCPLATAYCPLPTAHCLLPTAYCTLPTNLLPESCGIEFTFRECRMALDRAIYIGGSNGKEEDHRCGRG
jgi:hypothetical protein